MGDVIDGHDYLSCRLGTGNVTWGALRCDHLAYRLGMGSWHVVGAWSVSHHGHRWDMGYSTWWASKCDHLVFVLHDGFDYLVHSLGMGPCQLMGVAWVSIMPYGHLTCGLCLGSWNVGWALAVSHYGHWLCHITGIDWTWEMPYDGHDLAGHGVTHKGH